MKHKAAIAIAVMLGACGGGSETEDPPPLAGSAGSPSGGKAGAGNKGGGAGLGGAGSGAASAGSAQGGAGAGAAGGAGASGAPATWTATCSGATRELLPVGYFNVHVFGLSLSETPDATVATYAFAMPSGDVSHHFHSFSSVGKNTLETASVLGCGDQSFASASPDGLVWSIYARGLGCAGPPPGNATSGALTVFKAGAAVATLPLEKVPRVNPRAMLLSTAGKADVFYLYEGEARRVAFDTDAMTFAPHESIATGATDVAAARTPAMEVLAVARPAGVELRRTLQDGTTSSETLPAGQELRTTVFGDDVLVGVRKGDSVRVHRVSSEKTTTLGDVSLDELGWDVFATPKLAGVVRGNADNVQILVLNGKHKITFDVGPGYQPEIAGFDGKRLVASTRGDKLAIGWIAKEEPTEPSNETKLPRSGGVLRLTCEVVE